MSRRRLLVCAAAVALTGCGFALRQTGDYPFKTLYAGFSVTSPLGAELSRQLLGYDLPVAYIDRWANGLRVPGAFDGFELAVRAVLGQQITVKAARTLGDRLVQALGQPCQTPWPELNRHFPDAATLAREENAALMGSLGIVRQRQRAIQALARAVDSGQLQLTPGSDIASTLSALQALPGIGPWTAHYLAMRTLHWEDAWPVQDVALQSALGVRQLAHPTKALEDMGQAWRPFRSYALMAAWARATPSHLDPENP